MANLLDVPERLAKMLIDCDPAVNGAYWLTQPSIDEVERPCWLIFPEDASYPYETSEQEQVQQGYSIAFIGAVYTGLADAYLSSEYERQARIIADSSVLYLLRHQQMQMSDLRGQEGAKLQSLDGVTQIRIDRRSGVTLFTRDGVSSEAFWGFTIDLTVTQQLAYDMVV